MKAKKVFERIFTTIQIIFNFVFGGVTLIQLGIVLFDHYASVDWSLVWAQVLLMIGWNVLNCFIRHLFRNY